MAFRRTQSTELLPKTAQVSSIQSSTHRPRTARAAIQQLLCGMGCYLCLPRWFRQFRSLCSERVRHIALSMRLCKNSWCELQAALAMCSCSGWRHAHRRPLAMHTRLCRRAVPSLKQHEFKFESPPRHAMPPCRVLASPRRGQHCDKACARGLCACGFSQAELRR